MSLFSKILNKLGIKQPEAKTAPAVKGKKNVKPASSNWPEPTKRAVTSKRAAASAPMAMVDVMSKLENMAKGTNLDWKVSIVDLLKVLGIDSSLTARKELAVELGCPPEKMKDSADMNIWLHKTVLTKISENGGNIPKDLLD